MRKSLVLSLIIMLVAGLASAATATFLDFEDLGYEGMWAVGSTITSGGVSIPVSALSDNYQGGICSVCLYEDAGSGKELSLGNTLLTFGFGPSSTISLKYASMGGTAKLGVNGAFISTEDLSSHSGTQIGGVDLLVTQSGSMGEWKGILQLSGAINSFSIGGQEFCIDDVMATAVPEPSSMLSLVFGLAGLAGIRMRRR